MTEQVIFGQKLRNNFLANQEIQDSLTLDIAVAYFQLKMPDSCRLNLKKISANPKFPERKNELYFSALIVSYDYETAEKKIDILNPTPFGNDARISLPILKREQIKADTSEKNISPVMLDFKNRYINYPRYSPFLAGTFSAILPGAGKWYIGYKRQALTSFIANVLFGAQAAEAYIKSGASSFRFIASASLFGIFYSGNIWGSVLMAKKKKRDHLKELDYEILDYYHTEFSKLSR
ncbi:MAG: hypothetical protein ACHQHP_03680 [Bacteroidia bacterium]